MTSHHRLRLAVSLAVLLSACTTEPRPATLDYIVEAILAPSCGRGGCHSSDTRAHDLEFDTIDAATASLKTTQQGGEPMVVPGAPSASRLVTVLRDSQRVMPPDVPLSDADVALITTWIADGAMGLP